MRHPGCDPATRRRRFLALSRHPETTRQLLAELNADATDYLPLPDPDLDDFHADWQIVRMVLEDAPQKLTCLDILQDWPPDFRKPHSHTLWRWLSRAVQLNLVSRDGAGRKYDPFRYWLPECEQEWKRRDPFYQLKEDQRRFLAHPPHKFDADALRARFPPQDLPASPAEDGTEQ